MSSDLGQLHPGFVVLDSPLVTYKRRDTGPDDQVIPEDVATAFYQSLASLPDDKQVIVLENNDPPEELHEKLHYQHFSRSSLGRYGFFPIKKEMNDRLMASLRVQNVIAVALHEANDEVS